MDPLRITLIIIAILVIVALIINDRLKKARGTLPRQGTRTKKAKKINQQQNSHHIEGDDDFEIITKPSSENSHIEPEMHFDDENVAKKPIQPLVLSLVIMAPNEQQFTGQALHNTLEELGFKFGSMNIYHRLDNNEPLISIANVHEPGTFDINEIDTITTPGLAMFTQLPSTQPGIELFEEFVEAGHQLSQRLGGYLCNQKGELLSEQELTSMREKATNY